MGKYTIHRYYGYYFSLRGSDIKNHLWLKDLRKRGWSFVNLGNAFHDSLLCCCRRFFGWKIGEIDDWKKFLGLNDLTTYRVPWVGGRLRRNKHECYHQIEKNAKISTNKKLSCLVGSISRKVVATLKKTNLDSVAKIWMNNSPFDNCHPFFCS